MRMKKIEFSLPDDWKNELLADAEELDLKMGQLMRLLIKAYLFGEKQSYGYIEIGEAYSHPRLSSKKGQSRKDQT